MTENGANVDDPLSGEELRAAAVRGIRWATAARPTAGAG